MNDSSWPEGICTYDQAQEIRSFMEDWGFTRHPRPHDWMWSDVLEAPFQIDSPDETGGQRIRRGGRPFNWGRYLWLAPTLTYDVLNANKHLIEDIDGEDVEDTARVIWNFMRDECKTHYWVLDEEPDTEGNVTGVCRYCGSTKADSQARGVARDGHLYTIDESGDLEEVRYSGWE